MSTHSELRSQLATVLNRFSIRASRLEDVQNWLLSHLQGILDSQDALAIEVANEVDADLIELSEGLMDESAFARRTEAMSNRLQTISVDLSERTASTATTSACASETIVCTLGHPLAMNLDLRVPLTFEASAA